MTLTRFYLGTHMPNWLGLAGVPLFVSRARLWRRRTMPRACAPWSLDSGGFTEVTTHGGWRVDARAYASEVARYQAEIGMMDWAAPQDWMCEADALKATGLSIAKHQELTTTNFVELRSIDPSIPFVPVLQGWDADDYLRHADAYGRAGVDLSSGIVGVGTVCRRQGTRTAVAILGRISRHIPGISLHGFGFKKQGVAAASKLLASSDSLSWSYCARREEPLPGHKHKACNNCLEYALAWRASLVDALAASDDALQTELF